MKERIRKILESDFINNTGIDLGIYNKGRDEYRAATDAIFFASKRENLFWAEIAIEPSGNYGQGNLYQMNNLLEDNIKAKLEGESKEYLKAFKVIDGWLSRSILDGGVLTRGKRFQYLYDLMEKGRQNQIYNVMPVIRWSAI